MIKYLKDIEVKCWNNYSLKLEPNKIWLVYLTDIIIKYYHKERYYQIEKWCDHKLIK